MSEKQPLSSQLNKTNHEKVALSDSENNIFDEMTTNFGETPAESRFPSSDVSTDTQGALFDENGDISPDLAEQSDDSGFVDNEQFAMLDNDGKVNPELVEKPATSKETVKKHPLELFSVDELRTALAEAETSDKESALEDEAYDKNERREKDTPNRMSPDQPSLDSMERVDTTPKSADYNTRIASSADRISKWLDSKAEKYEDNGGAKGLAKKALRRLGSAAYRKSGLKSGVESVKKGAEAVDRAVDRTVDFVDRVDSTITDKVNETRNNRIKRRKEAHERALLRERTYRIRKQEKLERKKARSEAKKLEEKAKYEHNWRGAPLPDFLDEKKTKDANRLGRVGVRSPFYMKSQEPSKH